MRASREEFVAEMRQYVRGTAMAMFKDYDEQKNDSDVALWTKYIETQGYFKGVVSGILKTAEGYSKVDCTEEKKQVLVELDKALLEIDLDDNREELLDGCYELIEGLAVLIYDKKRGAKDAAA